MSSWQVKLVWMSYSNFIFDAVEWFGSYNDRLFEEIEPLDDDAMDLVVVQDSSESSSSEKCLPWEEVITESNPQIKPDAPECLPQLPQDTKCTPESLQLLHENNVNYELILGYNSYIMDEIWMRNFQASLRKYLIRDVFMTPGIQVTGFCTETSPVPVKSDPCSHED